MKAVLLEEKIYFYKNAFKSKEHIEFAIRELEEYEAEKNRDKENKTEEN